jgi:topoisomerase IA-like protein
MYVALTRAKRAVFALASELNASVFAKELATYPRVQSGATFVERTPCPKCGDGELLVREGKYGKFLGCSNYPSCKHNQAIESSNYHQINN